MTKINEFKKIIKNLNFDGVTRNLDELGRIVIPRVYRQDIYNEGTYVYVQTIEDCVIIADKNEFDTGIKKTLDELGRIMIPKEIRKSLNWNFRDLLMIWDVKNILIIKKLEGESIVCKKQEEPNKYICES